MIATSSPRAIRVIVSAGILATAALLAGCTAASTTPASTSPHTSPATAAAPAASAAPAAQVDSCSVVTQSEVESAFGATVQPGVRGKATVEGGVACVYYGDGVPEGTNPDVAIANSVRVVLVSGSDGPKWFADYKSKVPAAALAGLGDQAFWDGSASVSVLKGSAYLRIAVVPRTGPSESAEKSLAEAALPRM